MPATGWAAHARPQVAFGVVDPRVPRCLYQQIDSRGTRGHKQVVDISLTVADTDKVGLGTVFMDSNHRPQTLEPLVSFLRFDGAAFAGGPLAYPSRVRAQTSCAISPKGTRSGASASVVWASNPCCSADIIGRTPIQHGPRGLDPWWPGAPSNSDRSYPAPPAPPAHLPGVGSWPAHDWPRSPPG